MNYTKKIDWFLNLDKISIDKSELVKYRNRPDLLPSHAVWFIGLEHHFYNGELGIVLGRRRPYRVIVRGS